MLESQTTVLENQTIMSEEASQDTGEKDKGKGERNEDEGNDDKVPKGLMSSEEAEQHRLELLGVRKAFEKRLEEGWFEREYMFCLR